ncbi:MAG: helix-turn-helix domain-containing protein [Clostridia bacterium]|nr:helix-turn-helix domain-containing protein [Clostridia bacterium]
MIQDFLVEMSFSGTAKKQIGRKEIVKQLTNEIKWQAVINNNAEYDGAFYYAVKTTGIFCRPSCKSRVPSRKNVVFFHSPEEALKDGFRPCKRCRPDEPELSVELDKKAYEKITWILEEEYMSPDILPELPLRMGISAFHLQRSYKKHTGYTPRAYLQKVRIIKAKQLLLDNQRSNTEICFSIGFHSLSSFYAAFRAETGLSPGKFRNQTILNT